MEGRAVPASPDTPSRIHGFERRAGSPEGLAGLNATDHPPHCARAKRGSQTRQAGGGFNPRSLSGFASSGWTSLVLCTR